MILFHSSSGGSGSIFSAGTLSNAGGCVGGSGSVFSMGWLSSTGGFDGGTGSIFSAGCLSSAGGCDGGSGSVFSMNWPSNVGGCEGGRGSVFSRGCTSRSCGCEGAPAAARASSTSARSPSRAGACSVLSRAGAWSVPRGCSLPSGVSDGVTSASCIASRPEWDDCEQLPSCAGSLLERVSPSETVVLSHGWTLSKRQSSGGGST
mmetsp:Transcript_151994/g.269283  ORF Transcript_151994/g.269283 Transcript_151994/m.269283 type:complete len:205 (+) Transcript_151994:797-1411(+)